MPGFASEASLYKSSGIYHKVGRLGALTSRAIIP